MSKILLQKYRKYRRTDYNDVLFACIYYCLGAKVKTYCPRPPGVAPSGEKMEFTINYTHRNRISSLKRRVTVTRSDELLKMHNRSLRSSFVNTLNRAYTHGWYRGLANPFFPSGLLSSFSQLRPSQVDRVRPCRRTTTNDTRHLADEIIIII